MSWFYFCLLSIFVLAVAELTQQYLLNKKDAVDERTSLVLTYGFQAALIFPYILITTFNDNFLAVFNPRILIQLLSVSVVANFGMMSYLKSFKVKNISISTIFVSCSAIVSTILGIIIFQESTSIIKFIGIVLILIAIVLLNIKNVNLERNHLYGIGAGLLFGVSFTLDKSILLNPQISAVHYLFWSLLSASVVGFLFGPKQVRKTLGDKSLKIFLPIVVSASGYLFYNVFTFTAYKLGGEVGRVDAINNSQIFLIILFEFFILKHKDSLIRKLISAVIAFTGVYILGNF